MNSGEKVYVLLEGDIFSEEIRNFNLSKLQSRTQKFLLTIEQAVYGVKRRQFHRNSWSTQREEGLQS